MFDLWSPEHSVLREKVIEHIFLAELSRSLLLDLGMPFEVLRSEFDAFGYDVVIEANGVMRHIQLKATTAMGARANVDVQLALADKAGGCVVWIFVDPQTLQLGPFLWFGGGPGRALPPLGDRAVKHTRGDSAGLKKVRAGLRRVPKGMFETFAGIEELAVALFGKARSGDTVILTSHLARRGIQLDRTALPDGLTWAASQDVAYMVDGYELAGDARLGDPFEFADCMRRDAERDGMWSGTLLELWVSLFMEHRRDRIQSEGAIGLNIALEPLPLLDELCQAFVAKYAAT